MAGQYDVFLSHSSADGPAVEAIAARLRDEAGLQPFLDAWHLVPGEPWMPAIERAIERSTTVAVFFGPHGRSAWHDQESQLALVLAADEHGKRVIPVLLPGARKGDVGGFMRLRTWVELGQADGFERLVAGVTGQAPGQVGRRSGAGVEPRSTEPSRPVSTVLGEAMSRYPANVPFAQRRGTLKGLCMLGPDLVFRACLPSVSASHWELQAEEILVGEWNDLARYSASFAGLDDAKRFLVAEPLGIGRAIAGTPVLKGDGLLVPVAPPNARSDVHSECDLLVDSAGLVLRDGDLVLARGLEAAPQAISSSMSTKLGEDDGNPTLGTRCADYYAAGWDIDTLSRLFALELARLAFIPHRDGLSLPFIEKVRELQVSEELPDDRGYLTVAATLELTGHGPWSGQFPVFVGLPNAPDGVGGLTPDTTVPDATTQAARHRHDIVGPHDPRANGLVDPVPSPPWDLRLRPDVAILIALPEEFRTIAAEYTRQWYPQRNPDHPGSDFLFVGPGGYRCVATIMPRMGPTVASQTSLRLLAFRPAVIINVGIAGGFKNDLRIGDVIVPRQVDAYDETAKIKGVRWERRGSDYRPSADLLADVLELEFTSHKAHARWADAGAAQLAELRAGTDQARVDELVQRKLLRDKPITSTNHLGSGSFVVASKPFAEFIREANADIHAGEMEAAGMMAAAEYQRRSVSTLVVRGISDHVDAAKSEVDAIGEGALRKLAMANAWRLVCTLMELSLLPRTEQANGPRPTNTFGAADPGPTIGWSRARLGMLRAEVPGRATEAPAKEPAPLMETRSLRATSPISEAYFILQEDRSTIVPHNLSPDLMLEGAYNGMLAELGVFSQAETAETVVSGYPALSFSIHKDAMEMRGVIVAVIEDDVAASYVAIAAGTAEDAGLVSRFVSSVTLEGDPPAIWSWNRVDLGQASAEWPAEPRRESSEVTGRVGAIRVTQMHAERPWALFIVEEIRPVDVLVATTPEHRLDRGRDARLARLTGSVLSERPLAFGEHPGRALDVQVHRPLNNHAGIRIFDTGDATYVATVVYDTASERAVQEAERFLSSIRPAGTQ